MRIRWSRYCSEVTAEVKGVTNAAEITWASAWVTTRTSRAYWAPTATVADLADDAEGNASTLPAMPTTRMVSRAMPKVRQNCLRVSRKPRPTAPKTPTGSSISAGTGR